MSNDEIPTVLRTHRNGCFEHYTNSWGTYLRPIDDPDATVIIGKDDFDKFELRSDINKIPADLWQRWVRLCFHFVEKVPNQVEVSVRILRSEKDPTRYRFLIPEQKVSMATVKAEDFNKCIDIETGEEFTSYPPVGWIPVGSSHSHNTMAAFFSATDDKYELSDPGIHIVVGSINKTKREYSIEASVVANFRRFKINFENILDASPVEVTFHEKATEYVDYTPPKQIIKKSGSFINNHTRRQESIYQQWHKKQFNKKHSVNDPFFSADDELAAEFFKSLQNESFTEKVELHQVEDAIESYIKDNGNDPETLSDFASLLMTFVDDIQSSIENSEPLEIA